MSKMVYYIFIDDICQKLKGGFYMPGLNGTGPMGKGPMTGRGAGTCNGGGNGQRCGMGNRRGLGRGLGRGAGRGFGRNFTADPATTKPQKQLGNG
jgi:hypothetical protein